MGRVEEPLEARQNNPAHPGLDWRTQTGVCVFITTPRINTSQGLYENARQIETRKQTPMTEKMRELS